MSNSGGKYPCQAGCAAAAGMLFMFFMVSCSRSDQVPNPYGLDSRPNSQCPIPPRPVESAEVVVGRVFSGITAAYPVAMVQEPGESGNWYLVEQPGRILGFDKDGRSPRTVVDLSGKVVFRGEAGLLDMAFHPDWLNNRQVFLSYCGAGGLGGLTSFVSRFQMTGTPPVINAASEKIIIAVPQPFDNHNGGRIDFGGDGYLYFGLGDGGSRGDPRNYAQNRNVLLGKMLRIDVDHGDPYAIPADNPFAKGGGRPEIFAWGFRNPWRWSFDSASGELWVGDVGQSRWEEVDRVRLGGNYGWRIREGRHCFNPVPCSTAGLIDPWVEYSHQEGCSVTGGFVYHGNAIPALDGIYVFGDYCSGNIWGIFTDTDGNPSPKLLTASGLSITSFAQDQAGEIYVLDRQGAIGKLLPAKPNPFPFPTRLSQSGFVDGNNPKRPAACLIPYDVQVPFWSDGADKERYFFVPADARIALNDQGHLDFPIGSAFIKHFRVQGDWIETRLWIRHDDGQWAGYSYEWNEAETDAVLLPGSKVRAVHGQNWLYPSRAQCLQCHTAAAGRSLGTEIVQLNRPYRYAASGRTANQLSTYDHIGLLAAPLPAAVQRLPVLASGDEGSADIGARARSYLHVNCANCHRPGGTARGDLDLRFTTPMPDMNICDVAPLLGDLGIPGARLLAPGWPSRSLLLLRMKRQDIFQMPPLGRNLLDHAGISLLENWIQALPDCR